MAIGHSIYSDNDKIDLKTPFNKIWSGMPYGTQITECTLGRKMGLCFFRQNLKLFRYFRN